MEIITIITCLLFTVPLHYSEDETLADTSYCTPYCATPGDQQPKQSRKESPTINTYLLFTVDVHSSEDKICAQI